MENQAQIVARTPSGVAPVLEIDERSKQLFKKLIAPGAPDEQVALIYHYARALRLDPLRRQVMLVSMKRRNPKGEWEDNWTIIVGVHGLLAKAQRHPDWAGLLSGVVYPGETCEIEADGTVTHRASVVARTEVMKPVGAWATVLRGRRGAAMVKHTVWLPFKQVAQVRWDANKKQWILRDVWAKFTDWMTEKCAIAFAIRKAFDDVVGGVYSAEEFGGHTLPDGTVDIEAAVVVDEPEVLAEGTVEREPSVSPSVQAGAVMPVEVLERLPERLATEWERVEAEPPEASDSIVSEVERGRPAAPDQLALLEPPEPPKLSPSEQLDKLRHDLLARCRAAEPLLRQRPLVVEHQGQWFLRDAELVRGVMPDAKRAVALAELDFIKLTALQRRVQSLVREAEQRGRK